MEKARLCIFGEVKVQSHKENKEKGKVVDSKVTRTCCLGHLPSYTILAGGY